jgi:flagellar assembly protein FliH
MSLSRVFRSQPIRIRRPVPKPVEIEARIEQRLPDPAEILDAARKEAQAILDEAREEAEALISRARDEAGKIANEAREAGRNRGYSDGHAEGLAEAQKLVEEAGAALEAAREAYSRMLADSEPRLLALVIEISRKVLGDAFEADPKVVLDLIRQGLTALRDEREFSLKVPPELVSLVEGEVPTLKREFGARSMEVVGDPEIAGGAIVSTPHGYVDVTIESQIRSIAIALAEARKKVLGVETA